MQHAQASGGEIIRVLVADDTRIHTQLLADALRRDGQLEVISSPSNSHELIEAARSHKIDIFVLSCKWGEEPLSGIEILRQLTASHPHTRAIMLMDSSKRENIVQAFRAGAKGIFSRQESVETLCKCIRSVHGGQIWANSQQMSYAVEALASSPVVRALDANGMSLLSRRELDVVHSLAEGLTNREIAERLGLSQHTIKNYLFRVFDKLGVSNRLELLFMTLNQTREAEAPAASSFESSKNGNSHRTRVAGAAHRTRDSANNAKPSHSGLPTAEPEDVRFRAASAGQGSEESYPKREG
jgi:DNA-binding NarL/FixJ family response regulator